MAKETMAHAEKNETPMMEAKYHSKPFLKKALNTKGLGKPELAKGEKSKGFKK